MYIFVAGTLHLKVSYFQLGSSSASNAFLASVPIVSVVDIHDVFENTLWYQITWYVDGVPYCKAVNKSFCSLTMISAANYSVTVAATVLANVTDGSQSTLMKKKSRVLEDSLLVKGISVIYWNVTVQLEYILWCLVQCTDGGT